MFCVFVLILILFPILKIKSQQEHLNRGFNQGIYSFDIIFEQQNLYNDKLTKTVIYWVFKVVFEQEVKVG